MKKYWNVNLILLSILFTLTLPYFQTFDSNVRKQDMILGFPIRFLTIQKTLKGNSLFSSFDIDFGSLVLSIIIVYIVLYAMFTYIQYQLKRKN